MIEKLKLIKDFFKVLLKYIFRDDYYCCICRYEGKFASYGLGPKLNTRCPSCSSLSRHRLFQLQTQRLMSELSKETRILHFAPEPCLREIFKPKFTNYVTCDYFHNADIKLDIENINLSDNTVDLVIANHVLEVVNDVKAINELKRVLSNDGILILTVPVYFCYDSHVATGMPGSADNFYFGSIDNLRVYGNKFNEFICSFGFSEIDLYSPGFDDIKINSISSDDKTYAFKKI